jgi:hypothetical protein
MKYKAIIITNSKHKKGTYNVNFVLYSAAYNKKRGYSISTICTGMWNKPKEDLFKEIESAVFGKRNLEVKN